jgi:hypothetical protein
MASLFAIFHVVVVVAPVLLSGGVGESQGFAVGIFDMPLVWLLLAVGGGAILNGGHWYVIFFCVVGTAMYALGGAVVGSLVDWLRLRVTRG